MSTPLADFFPVQEAHGLDWCSGQLRDYCPGDVHTVRRGSIEGNPLAGLAVFALWVGLSLIAIHAENKKRFISPLRHLELVIDDLKRS